VNDGAMGVTSQHSLHGILSIISQYEQAFRACLNTNKSVNPLRCYPSL